MSSIPSRPTPGDLRRDYGLDVVILVPHPGGFESECWVADGAWFVKTWRGQPPANLPLLERLNELGLPVVMPLRAADGELTSTSNDCPYAVFPFVRGHTATDADWSVTASSLKMVHEIVDVDLPPATLEEHCIEALRDRLDHPWLRDRRQEVTTHLDRLDTVIDLARARAVPHVLCHNDFGGFNLLVHEGRVNAILDWDACLGPREHDVWIAAEGSHGRAFLAEYGATDLDLIHVEYALLARALRDMAARVCDEIDRAGVETWGFARLARLDTDLEMFSDGGGSRRRHR